MNAHLIFITAALTGQWRLTNSITVSIGIIRNVSLAISQGNSSIINGTCATCLCALISNPSLFSFNCFPDNLTCQMHSTVHQDKPFALIDSAISEYYFLSLPTFKASTAVISTSESFPTLHLAVCSLYSTRCANTVVIRGISVDIRLDIPRRLVDIQHHTNQWFQFLVDIHHELRIVTAIIAAIAAVLAGLQPCFEAVQSIVDIRSLDLPDERFKW